MSKKSKITNIISQPSLRESHVKSIVLMKIVDKINTNNRGRITFAAQGIKKSWSMKRKLHSPRYTTNWDDLPIIN